MKKRNSVYLFNKKRLKKDFSKLRNLYLSCCSRSSFPDSGYFYNQKEIEIERICKKLKKSIKPEKWQRFWQRLEIEGQKIYYEYHEKIAYINDDGREYTAADMDELMCM